MVVIWRQGLRVLTAGQLVVKSDPRLALFNTGLTIRQMSHLNHF
jgi:hypothetical protein